jgi:serine/threonine protein kinase/Tfp pilus assembly protein PilF
MKLQDQSAAICPGCGARRERTSVGDIGCMLCLLRLGLSDVAQRTTAEASPALSVHQFGAYTIARRDDGTLWELGRGAMGITFRALDVSLNRTVALKVIHPDVARGASARERFLREARAAAALRHPNIATVYHFGICEETGQCFYAMELVEGETLDRRVKRTGPMAPLEVIDIARQIADALAAAETRGLVHRDLKPANLMIVAEESEDDPAGSLQKLGKHDLGGRRGRASPSRPTVKVIDFGVAKALTEKTDAMTLTHNGFIGTPAFASPEQFVNAPVDVRSDTYSLGATIWYLLTGRSVFPGQTVEDIRGKQLSAILPLQQLKAARVPSQLTSLLNSMLALEPAARPSTHDLALKLRHCRAQVTHAGRPAWLSTLAGVLIAAVLFYVVRSSQQGNISSALSIPEKSVAVLPFQNLSDDNANAYLASGIEDEILTRLSKIADLKVISHTSTQRYKSAPENLPDVARQLGVAYILEGNVQKSGDAVRINVQLIKATNDSHLWADTFDRKLTDIFSVETEVAKAIADQLRAKLTGQEEQVIAAKPTDNTEAYDAYLRGLAYILKTAITPVNSLGAQKYLKQAVRLDPKFALAWALLSLVDSRGYITQSLQPTVALREEARQAAETALTLQPNLGEAILAKGFYHYGCLRDYDTAVRYFEQARRFLPNSCPIPEFLACVGRRRGQWDQSEFYFNEAERLDPRNVLLLSQRAISYVAVRRFPEALRKLDQVLDIVPDDVDILAQKAGIAQAQGDLPRASALLASLRPAASDTDALETQIYQAILERHPEQIIPRIKEILAKPDPALGFYNSELRFWLGWAQDVAGDHTAAQQTWRQTRRELEPFLKEQPDNYIVIGDLALTCMGLGDKAAALALSERAAAVIPIEKDVFNGPGPTEILARVAGQAGERDRAIAALQKLMLIPYLGPLAENVPLTPALLRLDPGFDSLRSDPRFQRLIAQQ